jgi:hypothetical protein
VTTCHQIYNKKIICIICKSPRETSHCELSFLQLGSPLSSLRCKKQFNQSFYALPAHVFTLLCSKVLDNKHAQGAQNAKNLSDIQGTTTSEHANKDILEIL